jgi:2,3-diaminopropionate biosynthesis protein SbnB
MSDIDGFSIVTGPTVFRLLSGDMEGCLRAVRDAYLAHGKDLSVSPPGVFLHFADKPNARIIALPAHLAQPSHVSGVKWIASYPDNIRRGMARASAVLILNNHHSGYPFACLEGSVISAVRTAASALIAAENLTGRGRMARALGIVGTGFIARYFYRFLIGTGWKIDEVWLHDIDLAGAQRFAEHVCDSNRHTSIVATADLAKVVENSDLLLFATVATKPYLHSPALFEHKPVVLLISLRDLAPEILLSSYNIVDDIDHVMQAETSAHLTERLTGSRSFVAGTIADLIEGSCTIDRGRPVIFSPFGLGVLDIAVGKWVFDRALAAGEHIPVAKFFCDAEW